MKYLVHVILVSLCLGALGLFVRERNSAESLRAENVRLTSELAATARTQTAKREQQNHELERLQTEAREVHRLRAEVSQLRTGARELDQLRAENQQLRVASRQLQAGARPGAAQSAATSDGFFPTESWTFAGYTTPETALQSLAWAMREGDTKTLLGSVTSKEMERLQKEWGDQPESQIAASTKREIAKISSIRVLENQVVSDDEVVLSIYATGGDDKIQKISMKRLGGEWKMDGPKKE